MNGLDFLVAGRYTHQPHLHYQTGTVSSILHCTSRQTVKGLYSIAVYTACCQAIFQKPAMLVMASRSCTLDKLGALIEGTVLQHQRQVAAKQLNTLLCDGRLTIVPASSPTEEDDWGTCLGTCKPLAPAINSGVCFSICIAAKYCPTPIWVLMASRILASCPA